MAKRALLRPKWLLSHLLVVVAVGVMIAAGFWQLSRLEERRDRNELVESRVDLPEEPLDELIAGTDDLDDIRFRRVVVTGRFDPTDEVHVSNRSLDGAPGFWVLTPLVQDDGTAVVVSRGFAARGLALGEGADGYAPSEGEVAVAGYVEKSGSGGILVESEGLRQISRVDVGELAEAWPYELAPVFVQALDPPPPLQEVEPPDLGEGPHLGYAVQWFIFATITVVGYPIVLRRVARGSAAQGDVATVAGDERIGTR